MKNLTLVVLGIIALALMLCVENIARTEETAQPALAAQVPSTDSQPAVGPVAPAEPSRPTLVTEEARLSYAIGFRIGSDFKRQSVPVSVDIFVQGMRDAVGGAQPLMTDQELNETIGNFQKAQQAKAQEAYKQAAEKNLAEGEAFLAENAKAVGVEVLPSGLQYKVITEGSGQKPTLNDAVKSHYSGRLLNGTEFDSSIKRGMPVDFRLPQLIPGMREALLLMPAGSKWEIYIPAKLGYGPEGREGAIPPNAVLIFQVEVISIEKAPAAAAN